MIIEIEESEFEHYGILRRSGRYPWGSGGDQQAVYSGYLSYLGEMKRMGLSETEVARGLGISTTQLRAAKTIAITEKRLSDIGMAQKLKDKGVSNVEIARRLGLAGESSVRALLAPEAERKARVLTNVADMLEGQVKAKGLVDVGTGSEIFMGVSREKLTASLAILRERGYEIHEVKETQIGTGLDTTFKVLARPGTTQKDVWLRRGEIQQVTDFSTDRGESFNAIKPPIGISRSRLKVVYAEEGGAKLDGVVFVRPGVNDISLGGSRYAQVRIKIDDTHYVKGMAVYKDDMPDGVDLMFNTNKSRTNDKMGALKKLNDADPDLPFHSVIRRQIQDPDGNPTSAANLVNWEGEWGRWSDSIASQVLSKQSPKLAREQLRLTRARREEELKAIMALTNPAVRKKLLDEFSDSVDADAVHLKAAGLPRQAWHVILPVPTLKPNQIYAPNYKDGERVALIRYPHGGTFEIPELVVNNRHPNARRMIGPNSRDAVGIHHSVAERLSGADFDGDTVLVIPNNNGKIRRSPELEGLKDFDPKRLYTLPDTVPRMKPERKQQLMGDVSNLITDMTLRDAPPSEIARAVRHSMVVIDAEKHHLDYRRSAADNGIPALKKKYQGKTNAGASTLISRQKSYEYAPERKPRLARHGGPVDPATGRRVYELTGRTTKTRDGERVPVQKKYSKLGDADDAHTLSSGTRMEGIYADHSNAMKGLARRARVASINTPPQKRKPSAAQEYEAQVKTLQAKLTVAKRNAPLERQAVIIANASIREKRRANPDMDKATLKKVRYQELERARARTGAKKARIDVTQEEWDAIQAGAISNSKLTEMLAHANMDTIRTYATPRSDKVLVGAKQARAQSMLDLGYSRSEIAEALGVSMSTLDRMED